MRRSRLLALAAIAVAAAVVIVLLVAGGDEDDAPKVAQTQPETTPEKKRGKRTQRKDSDERKPDQEGRPGASVEGAGGRELIVGIGDQNPETFRDRRLTSLGVRHARLFTPWNSIFRHRAELDRWLNAVTAAGMEPFVAFNHATGQRCPARPCSAPSVAQFRRAFEAFRKRYPTVKVLSTWNEANHQTQPLARDPERAAAYYDAMRAECRDCTIVAADVLGDKTAAPWVRRFRAAAKSRPTLWGLHNYTDTNRFRSRGTRDFLAAVPGRVWITETGGIVKFTNVRGRGLPPSEKRAERAIRQMFKLARLSPRIERLYIYQWRVKNPREAFDAGLIGPGNRPRPGLETLKRELGR